MGARRKKIDTWEFLIDSIKVLVPVYMKSDDHGSLFMVSMPEYDYETCDRDINAMRTEVAKELRQRASMTWERFIYVTYCGHDSAPRPVDDDEDSRFHRSDKDGIDGEFEVHSHLTYEIIEVATRPDGETMYRYLRNSCNGGWAVAGLPQTGVDEKNFHFEWNRTSSSLIPFTTENMAALQNIRDRFIALNKLLEQRLLPEHVQQTLETVSAGTLNLMAPQ
jgi:hypothetical protein